MTFGPRSIERVLSVMPRVVLAMVGATSAFMPSPDGFAVVFDQPAGEARHLVRGAAGDPGGHGAARGGPAVDPSGSIAGYVAGLEEALGFEGTLDGASFPFPMLTPE